MIFVSLVLHWCSKCPVFQPMFNIIAGLRPSTFWLGWWIKNDGWQQIKKLLFPKLTMHTFLYYVNMFSVNFWVGPPTLQCWKSCKHKLFSSGVEGEPFRALLPATGLFQVSVLHVYCHHSAHVILGMAQHVTFEETPGFGGWSMVNSGILLYLYSFLYVGRGKCDVNCKQSLWWKVIFREVVWWSDCHCKHLVSTTLLLQLYIVANSATHTTICSHWKLFTW